MEPFLQGLGGVWRLLEGVSNACFSPTVNPCCYYPCQNQGVCVRFGLEHYQCDCTRTGYSGPNCTIRELDLQPLSLLLPCVFSTPLHLRSSLAVASFHSLSDFLVLLKPGFLVSSFLGPLPLCGSFPPCSLFFVLFWVLVLSCVIPPKGASYRFLLGPYPCTMGSSGLVRRDGLSGFHHPCS